MASRGSIALAGQVGVASGNLYWTLVAPDGEAVLKFVEPRPEGAWRGVTAAALDAIADRAARRVVAALTPPARPAPDAPMLAPVVLVAVRGAPGDGGPALTRAMRHALARVGITVNDAPDRETLAIQGQVSIAAGDTTSGGAHVAIAWQVLRPDGTALGTVRQGNRVAAARLAGSWGPLAEAVASAGAPGIAALILRAGAYARPQPAQPVAPQARETSVAPPALERPVALSATLEAPIARLIAVGAQRALAAALQAPIARLIAVGPQRAPAAVLEAPIAPSVTVR